MTQTQTTYAPAQESVRGDRIVTSSNEYEIVTAQGNPDDWDYGHRGHLRRARARRRLARGGQWSSDGIGEPNRFESLEEAREAIAQLRALGEEWAQATYGVRVRGDDWPEEIL
ncbi:MAG: hypothetical protein NUW22_08270 [Acidobacteria bacterium]|nr:hypothetical protein [Acidobacteriota bacterium]